MTESGDTSGNDGNDMLPDLSSLLSEGTFGPSWASGKSKGKSYSDHKGGDEGGRDGKRKGQGKTRDRRQGAKPRGDRPQGRGRHGDRKGHRDQNRPYRPDFEIQLQPHPTAFAALMKAMRDSCRTFELFELSRLFLTKSDRFVAKVHPKENPKPAGEGAPTALPASPFHLSVPDGIGFETEAEAIDHVLGKHLGEFFEIEEVEKEPPNGSFSVVNRCTVTGTLLAPPNYHRYRDVVQGHFASKIHGMSRERFESRIETVREKEAVDEWLESMKKGFNYKAKEGGQEFQHLEEARRHLLMSHKAKVVRPSDMVRIEGKDLQQLPNNRIRRSIEAVLEKQIRVPLDFSNHLRGRLRRANFTIYKRGGKGGITYACAVKRQYRTLESSFSDSIQELVEFIEKNPDITAQHILKPSAPEQRAEEASPEAQKPTEEASGTPAETPEEAKPDVQEEAPEGTEAPGTETPETQEPESSPKEQDSTPAPEEKTGEDGEPPSVSTAAPEEGKIEPEDPKAEPKPEERTKAAPSPEPEAFKIVGEIPASETLGQDLRWLIQYGYVTEFSDGRLFAPPIKIEQPPKEKAAAKPTAAKSTQEVKEQANEAKGEPVQTEAAPPAEESSEPTAAESLPVEDPAPTQQAEESTAPPGPATETGAPKEETVEDSPSLEAEAAKGDVETPEDPSPEPEPEAPETGEPSGDPAPEA